MLSFLFSSFDYVSYAAIRISSWCDLLSFTADLDTDALVL